jgi:hypothetical protein
LNPPGQAGGVLVEALNGIIIAMFKFRRTIDNTNNIAGEAMMTLIVLLKLPFAFRGFYRLLPAMA